ncbi:hypothetical protein [Actinomadura sp. J1-007]|uniref:hypothetical protein n=1 Tax=Actinomadura sp. J1-007 TaxID=2661913 RepID=UPI0019D57A40|nr:hypothetical protein [Actinomadura sp. J1-007]
MKTVERRLLRFLPRRVLAVLLALVVGQGVLLVVQAGLLARAVADLDAGPLPWLAGAVAGVRCWRGWGRRWRGARRRR